MQHPEYTPPTEDQGRKQDHSLLSNSPFRPLFPVPPTIDSCPRPPPPTPHTQLQKKTEEIHTAQAYPPQPGILWLRGYFLICRMLLTIEKVDQCTHPEKLITYSSVCSCPVCGTGTLPLSPSVSLVGSVPTAVSPRLTWLTMVSSLPAIN